MTDGKEPQGSSPDAKRKDATGKKRKALFIPEVLDITPNRAFPETFDSDDPHDRWFHTL